MNTESLYQFLENKNILTEEAEQTMVRLLEQYPWFGGGQLLYALMKKKENRPDADAQRAKAQLYLSNPLWSSWQMEYSQENLWAEPEFLMATYTDDTISQVTATESSQPTKEDFVTEPELSISKKEATDSSTSLSFEPLHTVDYFASQGIRLRQEQLGNDTLSKQVKTFTQWLQTMKKIYHAEQGNAAKVEDKSITRMADASNETEEIITETMADVLIQQGKFPQAITLLEKLSLLHPEKSSYFTARISDLKI